MRKLCLFVLAIAMIFTGLAGAQAVGDYRSVASTQWSFTSTWQVYNGTDWVAASVVPTSANNVAISAGDSVQVDASGKNCYNLTIEAGAKLITNNTVIVTPRYINVYGTTLINNGILGASQLDVLSINFGFSNDLTIQGVGVTNLNRVRPNGAGNYGVTFDKDVNLHFSGSALFVNGKPNTTFTVNSGATLTFADTSFFSWGTNDTNPSYPGGSFYIYGTVVMAAGKKFNCSVRSGNTSLVHVYGTLVLGDRIIADCDTTTGSETVIVNGNIAYTSTDTMKFDHLYTNNPTGVSFGFPVRVNNILSIGWGDFYNSSGLTLADSSTIIRYYGAMVYTPTFEGGVSLRYGENPGGLPLYTALEVPSDSANHIYDAYFDNPYGVYLNSTITAFGTVTLDSGIVDAGGNILGCYNQPVRNTGYLTNGMLGIMIPAGDNTIAYYVGTDNGYSPATLDFKNVTTPNGVGVTCFGETHSEVNNSGETMQRYWEIGYDPSNPVLFDSCSIGFQYLPEDFNTEFIETDDEATMVVGQYNGDEGTWTFPEISVRNAGGTDDGGNIQVANLTGFSDFTVGKNQSSLGADETPPTIVATYPANGDSNVALDAQIFIAFSEPMDTLSLAGSMTPSPNEQPTWNATMDTIILIHDPMALNTTYTVSITGANDLAGNPLAVLPDSFMFTTTVGDTVKPQVIATYPDSGAVDVPVSQTIYIAFSEPINPATLVGNSVPDFETTPTWNAYFDTLFLAPTTALDFSTLYTLTLTAGTDMAGNNLADLPKSFSFTTEASDNVKPYIVSTSPADGAVEVPLDEPVLITFSEPIDTATFMGYSAPDIGVSISWNIARDVVTLTPDTLYEYYTTYTFICTSAVDLSGNSLLGVPDSFSFTTTVGDTVKPQVIATYPDSGAVDVPVSQTIYIAFSEPINPATLVGNSVPDFEITPTWNANFDTLFLTPTTALDFSTLYTLTLTAGTDMAGNNLADLPKSFSFTTAATTGVEGWTDTQSYTLQLSPVAPNPMTAGRATFQFSLPTAAHATLEVFNVLGQKVNTLVDGNLNAGNHTINWNGADRNGNKLTSGVYIYQLKIPGKTLTKRLTIIR